MPSTSDEAWFDISTRLTVPLFLSSLMSRSRNFFANPSSIAILTCTSLVLIKSTTTPNRSSVPKIPARKPCETLLRFELTFKTTMWSLIVTAVGSLLRWCSSTDTIATFCDPFSEAGSGAEAASKSSDWASGWITVPPPLGFSTFLILMGIFRRITCHRFIRVRNASIDNGVLRTHTCSIVNGCTTSLP